MTASRPIDVSGLADYSISTQSPVWWGQVLLACIEGTMFLILLAVYFYLRLRVDIWPPPGVQLPHLVLPSIALLPMLVSCYGSYWASEGAKKDDRGVMLVGLLVNIVFGAVYLVLRGVEWHNFNFGWTTDVHGSIVWAIIFLHSFDAVADLIFTLVLIVLLVIGWRDRRIRIAVHVDSIVWYFIAAIWLPLYAVVYWGPRVLVAMH